MSQRNKIIPLLVFLFVAMYGYVNAQLNFVRADGNYDFEHNCAVQTPANEIFIGCDSGIVLYSVNELNTIRESRIPGCNGDIRDLVWIDGTQTLFAATIDSVGVWKSSDRGLTWIPMGFPVPYVSSLVFSGNGKMFAANQWVYRMYVSLDTGITWSQVNAHQIFSVSKTPSGNLLIAPSIAQNPSFFYMSADSGATWDSLPFPYSGNIKQMLQVGNTDTLMALTNTHVHISYDRGITWSMLGPPILFPNKIWGSPNGTCFVGCANNLYYGPLTPPLNSWQTTGGIANPVMLFGMDHDSTLLIGGPRGEFLMKKAVFPNINWYGVSVGMGMYQYPANLPTTATIFSFTQDSIVHAGTFLSNSNSFHYYSYDDGRNWSHVIGNAYQQAPISMVRYPDGTKVCSGEANSPFNGDLWRSSNNGVNWDTCAPSQYRASIVRLPDQTLRSVYLNDCYESVDSGRTWTFLSTFPAAANFYCNRMLVNESTGAIFAMSGNFASQPIFVSNDGGATWNFITPWPVIGAIRTMGISQLSATWFLFPDGGGFNYSTDDGLTWQYVTNGLPTGPQIRTWNFYAAPCGQLLIQVDSAWVWKRFYKSEDNGNTWIPLTGAAPYFQSVTVTPNENVLASLGNHSYNVWRSPSPFNQSAHNCELMWPGDVNNDNVVDIVDLLDLGLSYGDTGTARLQQGIQWHPYISSDWDSTQISGANMKHADCTGNGFVDQSDTLAISNNFGSFHMSRMPETTNINEIAYLRYTGVSDTVAPGDTIYFELVLSSNNMPIPSFYGSGGFISWDTSLAYHDTEISFAPPFNNSNHLRLNKDITSGNRAFGTVRNTHLDTAGILRLFTISFVIDTSINTLSAFSPSLTDVLIMNSNREFNYTLNSSDTVFIDPILSGIDESINFVTSINPNPNTGAFTLSLSQIATNGTIEICDITGRLIYMQPINQSNAGKRFDIQIPQLSAGIYLVNVITPAFKSSNRIIIH